MKVYQKEISVRSSSHRQLIDITREISKIVSESGIKNGLCHVFVPHATAAIIANESESGLMQDILKALEELVPTNGKWLHNRIDNNADAHILASIIGPSRSFPVIDGRLFRGVWQNIFVVELDGPRHSRRVIVTVVGE